GDTAAMAPRRMRGDPGKLPMAGGSVVAVTALSTGRHGHQIPPLVLSPIVKRGRILFTRPLLLGWCLGALMQRSDAIRTGPDPPTARLCHRAAAAPRPE